MSANIQIKTEPGLLEENKDSDTSSVTTSTSGSSRGSSVSAGEKVGQPTPSDINNNQMEHWRSYNPGSDILRYYYHRQLCSDAASAAFQAANRPSSFAQPSQSPWQQPYAPRNQWPYHYMSSFQVPTPDGAPMVGSYPQPTPWSYLPPVPPPLPPSYGPQMGYQHVPSSYMHPSHMMYPRQPPPPYSASQQGYPYMPHQSHANPYMYHQAAAAHQQVSPRLGVRESNPSQTVAPNNKQMDNPQIRQISPCITRTLFKQVTAEGYDVGKDKEVASKLHGGGISSNSTSKDRKRKPSEDISSNCGVLPNPAKHLKPAAKEAHLKTGFVASRSRMSAHPDDTENIYQKAPPEPEVPSRHQNTPPEVLSRHQNAPPEVPSRHQIVPPEVLYPNRYENAPPEVTKVTRGCDPLSEKQTESRCLQNIDQEDQNSQLTQTSDDKSTGKNNKSLILEYLIKKRLLNQGKTVTVPAPERGENLQSYQNMEKTYATYIHQTNSNLENAQDGCRNDSSGRLIQIPGRSAPGEQQSQIVHSTGQSQIAPPSGPSFNIQTTQAASVNDAPVTDRNTDVVSQSGVNDKTSSIPSRKKDHTMELRIMDVFSQAISENLPVESSSSASNLDADHKIPPGVTSKTDLTHRSNTTKKQQISSNCSKKTGSSNREAPVLNRSATKVCESTRLPSRPSSPPPMIGIDYMKYITEQIEMRLGAIDSKPAEDCRRGGTPQQSQATSAKKSKSSNDSKQNTVVTSKVVQQVPSLQGNKSAAKYGHVSSKDNMLIDGKPHPVQTPKPPVSSWSSTSVAPDNRKTTQATPTYIGSIGNSKHLLLLDSNSVCVPVQAIMVPQMSTTVATSGSNMSKFKPIQPKSNVKVSIKSINLYPISTPGAQTLSNEAEKIPQRKQRTDVSSTKPVQDSTNGSKLSNPSRQPSIKQTLNMSVSTWQPSASPQVVAQSQSTSLSAGAGPEHFVFQFGSQTLNPLQSVGVASKQNGGTYNKPENYGIPVKPLLYPYTEHSSFTAKPVAQTSATSSDHTLSSTSTMNGGVSQNALASGGQTGQLSREIPSCIPQSQKTGPDVVIISDDSRNARIRLSRKKSSEEPRSSLSRKKSSEEPRISLSRKKSSQTTSKSTSSDISSQKNPKEAQQQQQVAGAKTVPKDIDAARTLNLNSYDLSLIQSVLCHLLAEDSQITVDKIYDEVNTKIVNTGQVFSYERDELKQLLPGVFGVSVNDNGKCALRKQLHGGNYLSQIRSDKASSLNIVYVGDELFCNDEVSRAEDKSENHVGLRVLHAATQSGWISNCLCFLQVTKDSLGNWNTMDPSEFELWCSELLLPSISPNSVIVVDSKPHQWRKFINVPKTSSKMSSKKKVSSSKGKQDSHGPCVIEVLAEEMEHSVLKIPPYHGTLNPLTEAWSVVRSIVNSQLDAEMKLQDMMYTVEQAVAMTNGNMFWQTAFQGVSDEEEMFHKAELKLEDKLDEIDSRRKRLCRKRLSTSSHDSSSSGTEDELECLEMGSIKIGGDRVAFN